MKTKKSVYSLDHTMKGCFWKFLEKKNLKKNDL